MSSDIDFWIKQAKRKTEDGHATAVLLVPYGGYQLMPLEIAEAKYKEMIVFPKAVEKIEVPVVTLQEYVQKTYDMGAN